MPIVAAASYSEMNFDSARLRKADAAVREENDEAVPRKRVHGIEIEIVA